jgi:hypothetical protein
MVMVGHNQRLKEPLTRGQKRGMAITLAVLVVAILAATAYGLANHATSAAGCVNVTVPSTLGAVVIHNCGAGAREFCRAAQLHNDPTSVLARPECVKAGITPAPASSSN